MARDSWYFKRSTETEGPISFEELFAMAQQGELTPQMEIRSGESGNWFAAEDMGGLFDSSSSGELPSLDDFSIVDSSFGIESEPDMPNLDGFSIVEEEDKLSSELESQLPRFATLEAVRSKYQKIQWYCRVLNHELGPMSADDLMKMLFDGELAPNDEVKSSAEPEWVPARTVVFLSSSGSDLDVIDSEEDSVEELVPTSGESASEQTATTEENVVEAEKPAEPPPPPILKVRSKQKWYCKLGGMGYGPIEAHKIKMWAEQDRVEPTDLLKLGRKGEWFEAWQIEALQLKKPNPKQAEPEVKADTAATETESNTTGAPVAAAPAAALAPMPAAPVAAAVPPVARAKPKIQVQRSNPLEALGPLMDPKILGGVGGVIALVAILYFVPLGDLFSPSGKEEFAKFQAFYQEYKALQSKQAGPAEYAALKKKANTELDPVIKDLESTAGSDYPALQQLLWAGRDYLPKMLDNPGPESARDQEKFENCLQEAQRLINKK
ncbi:DUF4339 domain-containing protein [Gimesia maris]|uniref:GYF domain-containing protein n=1 Tax=Gimesia maris TaxID=122 RepID=A0ABX5YWD8_9PLAN|nr:DUF4339 domain-containing protein [Gimesia maris]EDL60645.1 hypothetical protein PM8797T_11354 [Gimesia maris DSM 8797]QEG19846.1 hypothetical protein GmarT_57530 [Gimesia maris]QGQ27343.1 DUF4339 domain-containing protein [Gimesia maris]